MLNMFQTCKFLLATHFSRSSFWFVELLTLAWLAIRENVPVGSSLATFGNSYDWKSQIKRPPPDTRYRTEVHVYLFGFITTLTCDKPDIFSFRM